MEFGRPDVDDMLEGMSTKQLFEWLAFFKVRDEERRRETGTGTAPAPAASQNPKALQAGIMAAFQGMKNRRDAAKK